MGSRPGPSWTAAATAGHGRRCSPPSPRSPCKTWVSTSEAIDGHKLNPYKAVQISFRCSRPDDLWNANMSFSCRLEFKVCDWASHQCSTKHRVP